MDWIIKIQIEMSNEIVLLLNHKTDWSPQNFPNHRNSNYPKEQKQKTTCIDHENFFYLFSKSKKKELVCFNNWYVLEKTTNTITVIKIDHHCET